MSKIEKKLIIFGVVLVIALFVISGCNKAVGESLGTYSSDSDFKENVIIYNDDGSTEETTGSTLYADGAGAYLFYIGDELKVQTGQHVHVFELNGVQFRGESAKLTIDRRYIGEVRIGETYRWNHGGYIDKLTVIYVHPDNDRTKEYAVIGVNMERKPRP